MRVRLHPSYTESACHYSQRHCLIFWKVNGKEFMGAGTEPCDEAQAYVERNNKELGAGAYWYREVWVNTLIDLKSQCMSPQKFHEPVPGVKAIKS